MKTPMTHQLFVDYTKKDTKLTTSDRTPMQHGNAWIRVFIGNLNECEQEEQKIKDSWK